MGVVCKIWRQSDKYFQRYAPETNCLRTAQRRNIINLSIIHLEVTNIPKIVIPAYFLTKL